MENKEFYLNSDGIRLHAKLDFPTEEKEKYPLVIVIHGFTGHMEEDHIKAVAKVMNEKGFATLRVEMYGHGDSEGLFENHTLLKWMSESLDIIDYARGLEFVTDLYLCGHSQGGLLTMLAGAMKADVLKALIPLSPASMIPDAARKGTVLGVDFDPDHIPDCLIWEDGKKLSGNYVRAAQTIHVEDAIRRYNGRVLLVHGDEDEAVPYECAVEAQKLYKNAELVTIPGDTHCYDHHLDLVTEAVGRFMESFH